MKVYGLLRTKYNIEGHRILSIEVFSSSLNAHSKIFFLVMNGERVSRLAINDSSLEYAILTPISRVFVKNGAYLYLCDLANGVLDGSQFHFNSRFSDDLDSNSSLNIDVRNYEDFYNLFNG